MISKSYLGHIGGGDNFPLRCLKKNTTLLIVGKISMQRQNVSSSRRNDCFDGIDALPNFLHTRKKNQDTAGLFPGINNVLDDCSYKLDRDIRKIQQ